MQLFPDFEKEVISGKVRKVYFIEASDNYFISKAGELLREKLFGSKDTKENFFLKYADETPVDEVIQLCNNFSSLFSSNKIIILKRCEKYSRKLDALLDFTKKPDPDTTLLLVFDKDYVTEKKLDKTLDFFDFTELPPRDYFNWIKKEFNDRGCSINDPEISFFISSMPLGFDMVITEIEKISNYDFDGNEKAITKDIILTFTGFDKEYSPDELVNSIIKKDTKHSQEILSYLLNKGGINEIYLLSIITNYFADLLTFKTKGFGKFDNSSLYGKYKLWGERLKFAKNSHSFISEGSLKFALTRILETDQKLKTSMLDSKILLTSLIEDLVSVQI